MQSVHVSTQRDPAHCYLGAGRGRDRGRGGGRGRGNVLRFPVRSVSSGGGGLALEMRGPVEVLYPVQEHLGDVLCGVDIAVHQHLPTPTAHRVADLLPGGRRRETVVAFGTTIGMRPLRPGGGDKKKVWKVKRCPSCYLPSD